MNTPRPTRTTCAHPVAARRRLCRLLSAGALAFAFTGHAAAADPARILVPFPAGGAADFMGRLLAEKLKDELGQQVLVENRPGAGTRLAAETLKQSKPDGATVLLTPLDPMVIAPAIFTKLRYDPATDFTPITDVASLQFGLAVSGASPYKTLADYTQAAKVNRDLATLGISALGTSLHFVAFDFVRQSKADISIVPFQGGPAMVTNVIGGQIPAIMDGMTVFTEHHRAGKLRVLAVSGARRSPDLPDVPTFAESGYPSLVAAATYVLYAPAGTPAAQVTSWNQAMRKVLAMPDVRSRLEKVGYEVSHGSSPAEVKAHASRTAERWLPVIKASGFKGD